jgi:hypothetical protein
VSPPAEKKKGGVFQLGQSFSLALQRQKEKKVEEKARGFFYFDQTAVIVDHEWGEEA